MNNLAQLLQRHADTPDKVLYRQWETGATAEDSAEGAAWRDYTVAQVIALAARWQQAFRARGFEKGDRIAICLKNGVQWVAIDQAALGMGLVQGHQSFFVETDHAPRITKQHLALFGEFDVAAVAVQQLVARQVFELAQLHAHSRLGAAQILRCAGKAAAIDHRREGLQQSQIQVFEHRTPLCLHHVI